MAYLEQSMTRLVGEYDQVQKKAFTKWVNMHLEKVGLSVEDLFTDLQDGTKLLKLLNVLTGVKLPCEKGKMIVHKKQNIRTALNFLTEDRMIRIVGIPVEEIVAGKPKLTLALVWMLILNFELSAALQQPPNPVSSERSSSTSIAPPAPPKQVSARAIKKELLEWAQRATDGYDEVRVKDFTHSWKDGMAFCAIIDRHRPYLLDYDDCDLNEPLSNLEKAFSVAESELGVIKLLDPEDVHVAHPPEEVIVMYVSALKQVFSEMPPPHRRKGPPVSPDDYLSRYNALLEWVCFKQEQVKNRNFPGTTEEMQDLLDSLRHREEDEEKEKEKNVLAGMAQELAVFQQKKKTTFDLPPFSELEKAWADMVADTKSYEKAAEEELERLKKLDCLARKLLQQCESQSVVLETLGERLNGLEKDIDQKQSKLQREVGEIQDSLKTVSLELNSICTGQIQLETARHHSAVEVKEKVAHLKDLLSQLTAKLEECVSTVGEVDVLLGECGRRLKDCEQWLVAHGKFADNELIMKQLKEHQSFEENQLAWAADAMERLNSLSIPQKKEDAVKEMNSRWQRILEQIKSRLDKLTPMSKTVSEFVMTKAPLETWFYEQQDYYNSLPLLETDVDELSRQKEEFEKERELILSHQSEVENLVQLSHEFGMGKQPVQTLADKYARAIRRQRPSIQSVSSVLSLDIGSIGGDVFEEDTTFEEQAAMVKGQWEWSKEQVDTRLQQVNDLLERLKLFISQYEAFQRLVVQGKDLLEQERPVGQTAQRISEQMKTCQEFRTKLTESQSSVDVMLSLGRSVIGEHFTNPLSDTVSEKLTNFIQEWSDLLLAWQNWYDELHASGEQSQNLSYKLDELRHVLSTVQPLASRVFPATLSMSAADDELRDLHARFTNEVVNPTLSHKSIFEALEENSHLLSNKAEIEELLEEYKSLSNSVCEKAAELEQLVTSVSCWWPDCVSVKQMVGEAEAKLVGDRPLSSSLELIGQQEEAMQSLYLIVEKLRPKVRSTVKHLTALSTQTSLIRSTSVDVYRRQLQDQWERVCCEVENRRDIVEIGKVRMSVYLENRDPFEKWLSTAEDRLKTWTGVRTWEKDKIVEQTEAFKIFRVDVELHSHDLQTCDSLGKRFLESAKSHQSMLLAYHDKVTDISMHIPLNDFFEWENAAPLPLDVKRSHGQNPQLHGSVYYNGIQVVISDLHRINCRFEALDACVGRRRARMVAACEKRLVFSDAIETFLQQLGVAEVMVGEMRDAGIGKHSSVTLKEQLENLETLESSSSELSSLCDSVQTATNEWTLLDPVDSDDEGDMENGDVCVKERNSAYNRYEAVQEQMRLLRCEIDFSLAEAQAFQAVYSSFAAWLRDTERKIQRDDSLKLELSALSSGRSYLKVISGDIAAHEPQYSDLCQQIQTALTVVKGPGEDDLREKLSNLETRWIGIQVVTEDMEVIESTISHLESFLQQYSQLSHMMQSLLEKLKEFTTSAISSVEVSKKSEELEALGTELAAYSLQFDALSSDYADLFQTPFDQTKLRSDFNILQSLFVECTRYLEEKQQKLTTMASHLLSLEERLKEFETWLQDGEQQVSALAINLGVTGDQKEQSIKQAQELQLDVAEHEPVLETIEALISSFSYFISEDHSQQLYSGLELLSKRYQTLNFDVHCVPVSFWLLDSSQELMKMKTCAVLTPLLQSQISVIQLFQKKLEDYSATHEALTELSCSLSSKDRVGLSVKMTELKDRYWALRQLCKRKVEILVGFYPRVKLYGSSLVNWEELLTQWEKMVAGMAEPTASLPSLLRQIDEIKSLQLDITNHEPEFQSLEIEAQQLFTGPKEEHEFVQDLLSSLAIADSFSVSERPGQKDVEQQLADDKLRLDALKETVGERAALLSALHERAVKFEALISGLLPWLQEHQSKGTSQLAITEPTSCVLQEQLDLCKSLQHQQADRFPHKQELGRLCSEIVADLPSDSSSSITLSDRFENVNSLWLTLHSQLSTSRAKLESVVPLARSYEKEKGRLVVWVQKSLDVLTDQSSLPSETQAIQHLKQVADNLKSEYNGFAPLLAKCLEEGQQLANKLTEESTHLPKLLADVQELQNNWNTVGELLASLMQKLNGLLVQTLEFQQLADNLERWVTNMQTTLKETDHVATRVKLIEQQIEGQKPLMEDIKVNSALVDQTRTSGSSLMTGVDSVEMLKIERRLHALEVHFFGLEKTAKQRMLELQEALQLAMKYEDQCGAINLWLKEFEKRRNSFQCISIRSQPLKAQLDEAKVFKQSVDAYSTSVDCMTTAEVELLCSDLTTVKKYETTLRTRRDANHPQFVKRPGFAEVVEVGAALRHQYEQLKVFAQEREDEISQCLIGVVDYESVYEKCTASLNVHTSKIPEFEAIPVKCVEIKSQLDAVQAILQNVQSLRHLLEEVNAKGTSLMVDCNDRLSCESVKKGLSDLNELWSHRLSSLNDIKGQLRHVLALAEGYQKKEEEFGDWLDVCEQSFSRSLCLDEDASSVHNQQQVLKTLLDDVSSHQSQLSDLVSCGKQLESSASVSQTQENELAYGKLQERYNALDVKLKLKEARINEAMKQASTIKYQLSSVLRQLQVLLEQLSSHGPPSLDPSKLEKQLEHLEDVKSSWDGLQSSVSELTDHSHSSFSLHDGEQLQALVSEVNSTNTAIDTKVHQLKKKLLAVQAAVLQFTGQSNVFHDWVQQVHRDVAVVQEQGVRASLVGIQEQLDKIKKIQDDISQHRAALQDLMELGRGIMNEASSEDFISVSNQLAQLQASYELLQRQLVGKQRLLNDQFVKAQKFNDENSSLMTALANKTSEMEQLPSTWTDFVAVRAQLEEYKEFEGELADIKARVVSCNHKGKELMDTCCVGDKSEVEEKVELLMQTWNKVQSASQSYHHQLEDALLRLGQFNDALSELMTWLKVKQDWVHVRLTAGVTVDGLEEKLSELQVLQSDVVAREASVHSLNEVGRELLKGCEGDNLDETQRGLEDMNQRWAVLKRDIADSQVTLRTALERARCFNTNHSQVLSQVAEAERLLLGDWKPCGLPDTCQADIDNHKSISKKLSAIKIAIAALQDEGNSLKPQGSLDDEELIDGWIKDVEVRLAHLVAEHEKKQALLDEAKVNADMFNKNYLSLQDHIVQLEDQIKAAEHFSSDDRTVTQHLDDHKTLLQRLESVETQMEGVLSHGGVLICDCVQKDGVVIQNMLQQIQGQFDQLRSVSLARLSSLKELLLSLGQFEEAYDELKDWLANSHHQLQNPELVTGDVKQVTALLTKHKALQKELGSRTPSYNSVLKEGKELVKSKKAEGKAVLKRKLIDLKCEWESVCSLSVARQQKLEETVKKMHLFGSHLKPMKEWISELLLTHESKEPVYGDIDTVSDLLMSHTSFQDELMSYQKSIDAVTAAGEHLITRLDDPSIIKQQLEELKELWHNLCQQAVEKEKRLGKAKEIADEFSKGLRNIWQWMDEMEADVDQMVPPSEDYETLQQQLDEIKAFNQTMMAQHSQYEAVLSTGQQILTQANHRAISSLQSQLHLIQAKWNALQEKINTRHEKLVSELLEMQGIQNMLDKLMNWVEQAENDMSTAEATPVSEDLETVEKQLAEHEQFQEVMATYQPNMDALDKATRKRQSRTTIPKLTNPEMIKKTQFLKKQWKKLWLRSSERHRQLLEARTRQKDIALARSFNFEVWRKRFIQWADQQKLRVAELFRRFDTNHDGRLTRDELLKGLKASGLSMTQIEMEKIADTFDKNRSGLIDLADIIAILKGHKVRSRPVVERQMSDAEKIEFEIQTQVSSCCCPSQFRVTRVGEGQYRFGDSQKLRMVRILRSTVMVRVGGGWQPLKEFLDKNDPCRLSGRQITDLKDSVGVIQIEVGRNVHEHKRLKPTTDKDESRSGHSATSVTRALHSGHKYTPVTKKTMRPGNNTVTETAPVPDKQCAEYSSRESFPVDSDTIQRANSIVSTASSEKEQSPSRSISGTPLHNRGSGIPRARTPSLVRPRTPSFGSITQPNTPVGSAQSVSSTTEVQTRSGFGRRSISKIPKPSSRHKT